MIIPIKCFTCGHVLADIYTYYCEEVCKRKQEAKINPKKVKYFSKAEDIEKTHEAMVMDELRLEQCCRRHFLTHCDLM